MRRAHLLIVSAVVLIAVVAVSIFAFISLNPELGDIASDSGLQEGYSSGLKVEWQHYLPGISGTRIIQTSDGGYLALGTTATLQTPDDDSAYFNNSNSILVKTDSSGNLQWQKTFQVEDLSPSLSAVIETSDGGYAVAGGITTSNRVHPVVPYSRFCLLKLDSQGNVNWTKTYACPSPSGTDDVFTSIRQTENGGYMLYGVWSMAWYDHPVNGGYLMKTDAAGNVLSDISVPSASSMEQVDDGYVFFTTQRATAGGDKYLLIKTDFNGNRVWSNVYSGGETSYEFCGAPASDGGYLIGGMVWDKCGWLVKTDISGNMVWNRSYTCMGEIDSITSTSDGDYVLGGTSSNATEGTAMVAKIDVSGNIVAQLVTGKFSSRYDYSSIKSVIQTSDGEYALVGTWDIGYPASNAQHFWIAKLKPNDGTS